MSEDILTSLGGVPRLDRIMARRRDQLSFRLAMMTLMVLFFSSYLSILWMVAWAAAYTILQVWERFAFKGAAAESARLALLTLTLNSVVFGLPALLWAYHGDLLGFACGAYLLSGSVLNAVLMTRSCKPAFIASISPFLVYVMASAVLAAARHLQLEAFSTVGIAGAMMCFSAITVWSEASKSEQSESAALSALGDREAELKQALFHAKEASEAKSAFLANMSHELRTPLNGILGLASVLKRAPLAPEHLEMVDVILVSAKNLQSLVSDVLDLAKIEAAQVELQSEAVAPGSVIRSVGALFAAACVERGLRLDLEVTGESERGVVTDRVRLTQIITNLVSNAIKFTEHGGVTLGVCTVTQGGRRLVTFEVGDTGIGISQHAQARLFERFAQADGSITRRFGGSGLGLSISKSLCEMMGGEIHVISVEGVGSTFTVHLDLPAVELDGGVESAALVDKPREGAPGTSPLRVLLVEDHPVNRQVVQLMLADVASVNIAVNGNEGLEAAKSNDFDVILMDMQMPVMDGVSAVGAIRDWEAVKGRPRTPIVMLTANATPEHAALSLKAGADLHLTKPITAEALFAALDEAMAKSEAVGRPPDCSVPLAAAL